MPILFAILAIGAIIGLLYLIKFIPKKQKEKEQLATENVSNQKQIQTEHTEQFFAKPMNLDKTITIIGLVSALIIWIFAIVQGFLG